MALSSIYCLVKIGSEYGTGGGRGGKMVNDLSVLNGNTFFQENENVIKLVSSVNIVCHLTCRKREQNFGFLE